MNHQQIIGSLILIFVIFYLILVGFLYRNNDVYKFRIKILNQIPFSENFMWRYEIYERVKYNEMLFQFWKPLKIETWYNDLSFLKP